MSECATLMAPAEAGQFLAEVRRSRGITQEMVATATSLSINTIKRVEAGRCNQIATILDVASVLRVRMSMEAQ